MNFSGKYLLVELSFPEYQRYGREYFVGVDDFLRKFEFKIIDKFVDKEKPTDDHGYLMLIAKI
jgi:hypothetical protein